MPRIIATIAPADVPVRYQMRCLDTHCLRASHPYPVETLGEAKACAESHARENVHTVVIEDLHEA